MRLIDADALIEKCGEWYTEEGTEVGFIGTVKSLVDRQPTIAQPEWIPVTERLPEPKNKEYWICTDSGYQCQCRWTDVNPFWTHLTTEWHWNKFDIPQYSKVIAWLPLPEPYEEADDDTE